MELGVVLGAGGVDIPRERALAHVFGYTVINDVSARDVQTGHGGQFFKGKSLDGTCPMGPWLVTADEVPDPQALRLTCRVNGVGKQDGTTSGMIFDIAATVEWLSRGMTLLPGDIIATGTPAGVGFARDPAGIPPRRRRGGVRSGRRGAPAQSGRVTRLIFTQVMILFLLLGVGAAARRTCLSAEGVKGMAGLVMGFGLPMMVFASFMRPFDRSLLGSAGRMLGYSVLVMLLLLLAGMLLFRRARADRRPALRFMTAFSNSVFMGFPLLAAVFPDRGVFLGAAFTVGFNLVAHTLGIMLFHPGESRPGLRKLLLNPVLLGTYAGLACFLGSVRLPAAAAGAINLVAGITSPMSMLIIGATLAEAKLRDLAGGPAEYC